MPLGSQVNVDPAASASPQPVAAQSIGGKLYEGVLPVDALGDHTGISANPLRVAMLQPPGSQPVSFVAENVAYAGTTATLTTLTPQRNLANGTAAVNHTVTAGKTFRPLGFAVSHTAGTAAIVRVTFTLRAVLTGTVAPTSPVVATVASVNSVATAGTAGAPPPLTNIPDLPGGASFGITNIAPVASAGTLVTVSLFGIEF